MRQNKSGLASALYLIVALATAGASPGVYAAEKGLEGRVGVSQVAQSQNSQARVKEQKYHGKKISLPNAVVYTDQPIYEGSHFTWGEATKQGTRVPKEEEIVDNIVSTAHYMDKIRAKFGNKPVIVNSWYRTPEVNKAVGGADNSQHTKGRAVDFKVRGIEPGKVYDTLDSEWEDNGGLGRYSGFTHIDDRGYKARWSGK